MATVKITTVGNSLGIILPREIMERLRVDKGDLLYLVETPTGIELTPYEPVFAAQMEALERTARSERDLLRRLAQQDVSIHSRPHPSDDKPTDGLRPVDSSPVNKEVTGKDSRVSRSGKSLNPPEGGGFRPARCNDE